MPSLSESHLLIERLAKETDVKPRKVERVLRALEKYIEADMMEPCTITFAHTRDWCGYPLCREG
ncbi:DNA binding, Hu-like domain protein [Arthrobacter phage Qui]|jgi:hypothetical protein|uniref:DNA binding, Hu-like domain protein n=1 Tax=Arthrobacter phage Qui TaxID=2603260 RepID=A0A5B8WH25_9CAUD|nr:DNA binding, Hu-like domain protein [Arthrobacter phage Qui]QED11601.1 DNA binding, Hu-like domain protein [Arthrobacter phage Qui]QOC56433.1 DNA binding, HU-like domain protein [Arthrobacter phage Paella]